MERPQPTEVKLSYVEKLSSAVQRNVAAPGSVRTEGEYFVAKEPNSIGLPPVDSCPGSTLACEAVCYAISSEYRSRTDIVLQENFDLLRSCESVEQMAALLDDSLQTYCKKADRLGIPEGKRNFRIHWSGDFFSEDYARAWRIVIEKYPDIQFYTYTRTFTDEANVVPILADIENLDLFLSVDKNNVYTAKPVLEANPSAKVGYLVLFRRDVEELIDILGRREQFRHRPCPENMRDETGTRKLPVISAKGGACSRCTYCIDKPDNWDVVFVDKGLEKPPGQFDFDNPVPVEFKPRPRRRDKVAEPVGELAMSNAMQGKLFN